MGAKMTKLIFISLLSLFMIGCSSLEDAFNSAEETKSSEIVVKKNDIGVLSIPSTGGNTAFPTVDDLNSSSLDAATVEFTINKYPKYGSLIFTGNLAVYKPLTDYIGEDFFSFEIYSSYDDLITTYNVSVNVVDAPAPPSISGSPTTSVRVGTNYNFAPTVSNPVSPTSFAIVNKPVWASFSSTTGELSGVPSDSDIGAYSGISIYATSGSYDLELDAFTITVTEGVADPDNIAPEIYGVASTEAFEGELYSFTPVGSDADSGPSALSFSIANTPTWATFTKATGKLSGTPGAGDVGMTTSDITIWVSDGALIAELDSFSIEVK